MVFPAQHLADFAAIGGGRGKLFAVCRLKDVYPNGI